MISKKKKIIVLCSMMVLLVITGFLNLTLNSNNSAVISTGSESTSQKGNFFANYRTERDSARAQEKLYYQVLLDSANASTEAKKNAESAIAKIAATMESELLLEGYIVAKGFNDAVVSFTENFVNVMVDKDELTEAEVAQIVQVVQEQTAKSIDNIKIIPV